MIQVEYSKLKTETVKIYHDQGVGRYGLRSCGTNLLREKLM